MMLFSACLCCLSGINQDYKIEQVIDAYCNIELNFILKKKMFSS